MNLIVHRVEDYENLTKLNKYLFRYLNDHMWLLLFEFLSPLEILEQRGVKDTLKWL